MSLSLILFVYDPLNSINHSVDNCYVPSVIIEVENSWNKNKNKNTLVSALEGHRQTKSNIRKFFDCKQSWVFLEEIQQ